MHLLVDVKPAVADIHSNCKYKLPSHLAGRYKINIWIRLHVPIYTSPASRNQPLSCIWDRGVVQENAHLTIVAAGVAEGILDFIF